MLNYQEYAIPFPQGMVERKLLGGIPKWLWLVLVLGNAYLIMAKQTVTFIPVSIVIYFIARKIYSIDIDFYQTYTRATKHKRYYHP